ncbi:MAG: putative transposase [Nocardia sp.]|nr:putative transposase [Nocardia sp.]
MFALVKKSAAAPARTGGASIGVDWGLVSMFTTSTGQILGQNLHTWLTERDSELTALTAQLQRHGLKPSKSARFRALNTRIRAYVRNEVGRLLNQLATQDVREIVVEKLDFRFGGLSKRLNRIVSRAGRAAVTKKLASLTETSGIAVTEVNPAHTSRTCSGCGYVDARNRTSQQRFRCRFCGRKLLADINAARTVLGRSGVQGGWLCWSRDRVLAWLDREFTARWRYDPTRLRERPTARGRSTAPSLPAESIAA